MSNYPSGYSEPEPLDSFLKRQEDEIARLHAANVELLEALKKCKSALEWVIEQGGGPECEHESGVVCFCKENNALHSADEAIEKHGGAS